jgi:predicted DsbA family dithiol-disulfide isomerase
MATPLKIDFVSDISCGWCAVGLHAFEAALSRIGPDIAAEFHFQPFELNPDMPGGGQNLDQHLKYKYGRDAAEHYVKATRESGAAVGFAFNLNQDSRIYRTFDAHRLLHWAGLIGRQAELQHALFEAHFTDNKDPGDHAVLLACAATAQLDVAAAGEILASDTYADKVRELTSDVRDKGIHAVPTIIINDQYVITGSRSAETFEQIIRSALKRTPHTGQGTDA